MTVVRDPAERPSARLRLVVVGLAAVLAAALGVMWWSGAAPDGVTKADAPPAAVASGREVAAGAATAAVQRLAAPAPAPSGGAARERAAAPAAGAGGGPNVAAEQRVAAPASRQ